MDRSQPMELANMCMLYDEKGRVLVEEKILGENEKGIIFPGAMTPSEIADAYRYGASVVKLFPAGNLGLSYCKAVMAPINHIPMIAVGGVDDKNLPDFLKAGFIGLGIGSSLTNKKMIEEGRYDELKALAETYVKAAVTIQ